MRHKVITVALAPVSSMSREFLNVLVDVYCDALANNVGSWQVDVRIMVLRFIDPSGVVKVVQQPTQCPT